MKNTYNYKSYPMVVEFGVFDKMTKDDLENNPIKVLVDKETSKSIRMSLYCNGKMATINKNYLEDAKYLKRTNYSYATGNSYDSHYLKITKKQSGKVLQEMIERTIDSVLPMFGADVDICVKNSLLNDLA